MATRGGAGGVRAAPCPLARRAPATTSAPRVRVGATGHAVVLSPLILSGSHMMRSNAHPRAQGGLVHAPRRTVWGTEQLLPVVPDRREIDLCGRGWAQPTGRAVVGSELVSRPGSAQVLAVRKLRPC